MAISVAEAFVTLRPAFDQFISETRTGTQKTLDQVGQKSRKAGMAMTGAVTAPVVGIGVSAVRSFGQFDDAMTQSLAIMGDVDDGMRKDMSSAAREMAKETTFSATEAAESFFFLASAGLDAEQQLGALPAVASFGQAGMFDMARATDLLTDAQSALGLSSDDAEENLRNMIRVSDTLVGANTLANASVEQFSEALTTKAGAAFRQMGVDIESGVAGLALFADQGRKGSDAGTLMNATLEQLSRRAIESADDFEEMGISVFDSEGNMRNLADIVEDFEGALGGLSTEQQRAALMQLGFNRQGLDGLLMLEGNSEALREYERELRSSAGVTDEVAKNQLESANAQWSLFKAGLEDVAIELGAALVPALLDMLDAAQPIIDVIASLAEWFSNLDPRIQTVILAVVGIAAALGPLLITIGLVASGISAMIPVIGLAAAAFALLLSPIALVVIAIVGLGILIYIFRDDIMAALGAAWDFIKDIFGKIAGFLTDALSGVLDFVRDNWKEIVTLLSGPFMPLVALATDAFGIRSALVGAFSAVIGWVSDNWREIVTLISGPFMPLVALATDAFGIRTALLGAFNAILDFVTEILGTITDVIRDAWGFISDLTEEAWDAIWGLLSGIWESINELFTESLELITDLITGAWDIISAITSETWDAIWGILSGVWENIWGTINETIGNIKSLITGTWDTLLSVTTDKWGEIVGAIGSAMSGVWGIIRTPLQAGLDGMQAFVNGIIRAVNWVADKLRVSFSISTWGGITLPAGGGGGGGGGIPGLAKGTDNFAGGWAMVGEKGPELAFLPRHSAVIPNELTRRLLEGQGVPGFENGLRFDEVMAGGATVDDFWDEYARQRGGTLREGVGDALSSAIDTVGGWAADIPGIERLGSAALGAVKALGETAVKGLLAIPGVSDILQLINNGAAWLFDRALSVLGVGAPDLVANLGAGAFRTGRDMGADYARRIWPFAEGGIVTRPTLGMLAEGGRPEAVIPLDKARGQMGGLTMQFNAPVNIHNQGRDQDTRETLRDMAFATRAELRRRGVMFG